MTLEEWEQIKGGDPVWVMSDTESFDAGELVRVAAKSTFGALIFSSEWGLTQIHFEGLLPLTPQQKTELLLHNDLSLLTPPGSDAL